MENLFIRQLLTCILLLCVHSPILAGTRDEQVANISVYAHTVNGQAAYTYIVENKGEKPIRGFSVGFDHYTGSSELSGADPQEILDPTFWQSRIITLEESPYYEVRWEVIPGEESLLPGDIRSGFTIVTDSTNTQFLNVHWTALIDGPPTYASSQLEVLDGPPDDLDMTPPDISVTLEPNVIWPPNHKMIAVVANVTVSDDRDPSPSVSLVSISCNECDSDMDAYDADFGTADFDFSVRASRTGQAKPGRIYTVVYSATDSAGNSSEGRATVTVPHDQRRK
ncbi:MAG: hypothetical protein V8K32_10730 [Candidatus Electrothrix gigas]